jgi:predicted CxxxxCH...CXXCH cytochrome family protein
MLEVISKLPVRSSSSITIRPVSSRRSNPRRLLGVIPLLFPVFTLLQGCEREPLASGSASKFETNCSFCHGNEKNAAPPLSLDESDDRSDIGVGAHQAHLTNQSIATAIACEACHIVPETVNDRGHRTKGQDNAVAEVTFGELAKTANSNPHWNRKNARCTNTYCHGATLSGGRWVEPIWTKVDKHQIDCDACHGSPPPSPHIQQVAITDCATCHPDTVDEDGDIQVSAARHINGKTDIATECDTCHGKKDRNDAPPVALDGSEDTENIGVGAHQSHLREGVTGKVIPCEECHIVSEAVDDPGHQAEGADDNHAEVTFGELASSDNLDPSWDREAARCSNTYCHGASLTGGNHVEPVWTEVDNTQIDCDGCHGNPPPSPHPRGVQTSQCTKCHPDTVDDNGKIKTSEGRHINGTIDSHTACYSCHGTETINEAPPSSLDGSRAIYNIAVGAHQSHLQNGSIARSVACEQCHIVPEGINDPGHRSEGPDDRHAEVTFGELASVDNLKPSWDRETGRCANTYCHGASLTGGNFVEPVWTQVDNSQIYCDGCHGTPPSSPHPQSVQTRECAKCHPDTVDGDLPPPPHPQSVQTLECAKCHPDTVDDDGKIKISEGKHINGTIESRPD